jgi:hypothetical protein
MTYSSWTEIAADPISRKKASKNHAILAAGSRISQGLFQRVAFSAGEPDSMASLTIICALGINKRSTATGGQL